MFQPMPPDALERISLHSSQGPHSPTGTFQPPFPSPKPDGRSRAPTIGFAPDVTEHRYPATGARGEATHAHHVIDGPSVLRFPPSYPNAPTSRWSHSGSDKDYVDPYVVHSHVSLIAVLIIVYNRSSAFVRPRCPYRQIPF